MDSAKLAVSEQGASPATRSAAAIPSNIRRTLEESNLPIEVATAIADRLEASQPVGGEAGEVAEQLKGLQQIRFEGCQYGVISPEDAEKAAALIEKLARGKAEPSPEYRVLHMLCEDQEKRIEELKSRLDAPCEEVEKQVSTLLKLWTDKTTPANKEVVPADYARDLYRKWQEAQEKIYVLGTWRCAKCNLRLVATHLDAASGDMSANNEPQQCANGCGPMWRVTEREERQEAQRSFNAEWERAEAAEQRAAEAVARERTFANELTLLRELADHTSPYVNSFGGESNRRMAEIRKQLKAIRARSEGEGSG